MKLTSFHNHFCLSARLAFALALFLLNFPGHSQNLIPNGGFEEHTNGRVNDWVQPQGRFYHYTRSIRASGKVQSFNGLHLAYGMGSEYMAVKLRKPIEKGKRYHAQFMVKIPAHFIEEIKPLKSIGWKFTDTIPNISGRTFIRYQPDAEFEIDLSKQVLNEFTLVETDFTSTVNAPYLIIGFFTPTPAFDSSVFDLVNKLLEIEKERVSEIQSINDSFAKRYPPLPDFPEKISKKKARQMIAELNAGNAAIQKEKDFFINGTNWYYGKMTDSINDLINPKTRRQFDLLTYIDDVCLCEYGIDCCNDSIEIEAPAILKNTSYTLHNVNFETNKWVLNDAGIKELDALVQVLVETPEWSIVLTGHTDNAGDNEQNVLLSKNRAEACKNYLVSQGIAAERITAEGLGSSQPVADNDTEEGRAINRRVEFMLE